MSIITISRGSLSGGRALAERLAERLGYRCISSEALIEAAAKYGVPEPKLSEVFEKTPSFWERLTKSRRLYLIFIQAAMCELAQQGQLVYHGQGGQQLLKGVGHVMKVRLIAPLDYRIKAAMEREGLASREAAMQYIQQVDEERLRRLRYMFNVDWRDPALYDVVLNIEHMSLETAADVVIYMAQHPEYQPTPASEKKLNDLTLSCCIKASLAAHPTTSGIDVDVRADDGIVWVTGLIDSSELEYEIIRIAQTVSGVKEVISDLEIKPVFPYPGP
jgi:cytidylate kinase